MSAARAPRFLSDVEPAYGRTGRTVYLSPWYFAGFTAPAFRVDDTGLAVMALRDTLAAWLALPACVVCGAPFDHGCNTGVCSEACERAADAQGGAE